MKQPRRNLIPDCPNPTPDYYCAWQMRHNPQTIPLNRAF